MAGGPVVRAAWAEVRQQPGRLAATAVAIVLGVGFLVACLTFVATETHAIGARLTAGTSTSDVVARVDRDPTGELQRRVAGLPGVAGVASTYSGYAEFTYDRGQGQVELESLPPESFRWSRLSTGRWPAAADEIALGATAARSYHLGLAATLTVAGSPGGPRALRVVGIVDESRALLGQVQSSAVVDDAYFTNQSPDPPAPTLLVRARPGTDADALAGQVHSALGPDSSVETSASLTAQRLAELTAGTAVFGYLLLIFASIALSVGTMIILDTFSIMAAQRRRQLGLLRAVGASRAQVSRGLLAEAMILGLIGSALGVALGLGIATVVAGITGALADGLVAPPGQIVAAFAAGVLLTGLAAAVPAQRAGRVAPLEALRSVPDRWSGRRSLRRRAVIGGTALVVGAGVIASGLRSDGHSVALTVLGALITSATVLTGSPVFLPPVLRAVGSLTSRLGPVSRLATGNLVRNPARAGATCTALMLAVGLIVTLQVGAASLKATTADSLDREFPVDVTVTNPAGPLAPGVLAAVAAVPGVRSITGVRMVRATVLGSPQQVEVAGLGPSAAPVVSRGLEQLDGRVALAHRFILEMLGHRSGDQLTLVAHGRRHSYTLRESDVAAEAGMLVVTDQALAALDPHAPVTAVWAAAEDDRAAEVVADVRQAMAAQPGLQLAGSLEQAASVATVVDALLRVATALLAVAAAIALVGVGNTLGLSVIERTRESALLRALGLQRRQLRVMLMVEAVLLALVGAVVGVGAGVVFGTVGVAALVRETRLGPLHFVMSGPQTLLVVAVTGVAGALASTLPGRRAAMAAPTAALAQT